MKDGNSYRYNIQFPGRTDLEIRAGEFLETLVDGKGMVTYVVDEDVKAYIISELTMAIMMKYDPTRIPRKKKQL